MKRLEFFEGTPCLVLNLMEMKKSKVSVMRDTVTAKKFQVVQFGVWRLADSTMGGCLFLLTYEWIEKKYMIIFVLLSWRDSNYKTVKI